MSLKLLNDDSSFAWFTSENPTYAFLHGWGRSHNDFKYFFDKSDAIFIDLPGFGQSPQPNSVWSPQRYSEWLNRILPSSVRFLVGHSFGGRVAMHYINSYEGIERCILVSTPLVKRDPNDIKKNNLFSIIKQLNKLNLISDTYLETYKKRHGSVDYINADGVMRDILVAAINDDLSEIIKKVNTNVTLIWGDKDVEVPLRVGQEAMSKLRNSRLFVLKGVGHNPFLENPKELEEIINKL